MKSHHHVPNPGTTGQYARWTALVMAVTGCAGHGVTESARGTAPTSVAASARPSGSASDGPRDSSTGTWPESTRSPWPSVTSSPLSTLLSKYCGLEDGALDRAASSAAHRLVETTEAFDESELVFMVRAQGCPYVWPKSLAFEVGDLADRAIAERIEHWLDKQSPREWRRCGLADESIGGQRTIAVVTAEALGDLAPLPTRIRPSTWLKFDAALAAGIDDAKLVLLGPSGAPRTVPTTVDGRRARAAFSLDQRGPWIVQLVASSKGGPRPALEARVFAGVDPPSSFAVERAPGERDVDAKARASELADALIAMMATARKENGVASLTRNAELDRIALHHAEAMRKARTTAHDVGDGDPEARVSEAGLAFKSVGENVAHGPTLSRAHRAIWLSPSHRGNLLDPRYDTVGAGVAVDADGSVWICEVFAKLR